MQIILKQGNFQLAVPCLATIVCQELTIPTQLVFGKGVEYALTKSGRFISEVQLLQANIGGEMISIPSVEDGHQQADALERKSIERGWRNN